MVSSYRFLLIFEIVNRAYQRQSCTCCTKAPRRAGRWCVASDERATFWAKLAALPRMQLTLSPSVVCSQRGGDNMKGKCRHGETLHGAPRYIAAMEPLRALG
jgi:hypothetical protein